MMCKFKAKITDFEYYAFYESQASYLQDYHDKIIGLKRWLLCQIIFWNVYQLHNGEMK